jgi:hypothetical protein
MSKRLKEMVKDYLLRAGDNGKAKLSVASGLSVSTITLIEDGHIPLAKNIRKLALACGLSDEDAHELASLGSSEAKEAAS